MSGGDLVDALNQFMRGSEWQESIQIFVEANCAKFKEDSSNGFTHEQFQLWKNFQGIVESILASALDDSAGCTMKDFERALDELSREPAAGPREGVKKEILSQLLTYADFNDFSDMMHVAITYQYPEKAEPMQSDAIEASSIEVRQDNRADNRATLLQLSFPRDAVDHVIENSVMDSSLDYLIDQLHSMPPSSAENSQGKALSSDPPVDDAGDGSKGGDFSEPAQQERLENECINAFAQESLQDSGELRAKFVIALSVLDSVEAGDVSEGVLEQLTWASSMCNLFQEMVTSFSTGVPFELYNFTHAKGLLNWFDTLDKQFSSLKMGSYTGTGMSEQELRRIVALEDLAAMGTEDERLLHGLISRHEEVLKELSRQHGKCILMTSATTKGARIKREHLEELYLYLKEQVNSGSDLTAVSDEMFGQVSKLVSSEVSTDAVNLLLEIHVLEDEQILLKRQIMTLLRDPSAAKEDSADDEIQEISLFGSSSRPAGDVNWGEHKDDKNEAEFKSPERKAWGNEAEGYSSVVPGALSKPGYSLPPIISPDKGYRGIKQEIKDLEDKESLEASRLARIREQHRSGLKQLLNNLQDQKARAMRAMEAKMARRQKGGDGGFGTDQPGNSTRNVLEGNVDTPEDDDTPLSLDDFAVIEEALVAGYKRRCVQETRLASKNGGVVTSKVVEQAKENAAGELKRRHEEELRKLMEELAHGRQKERNRIKDMLYTRRQNNKNARNSTALQAEEDRLLKEFEKDYDAKEAKALAEVQRQACISLAAVITSESTEGSSHKSAIDVLTGGSILEHAGSISTRSSPLKRKEKDSEEENYFDSPSGKGNSSLSPDNVEQWLKKLREYTSAYGAVGSSLVQKAKATNGDRTNEVPTKVLRVVLNACENDLNDAGADFLSFSDGKRPKVDNMESIKARVLDEFERSRLKAEVDKARAGEESKSRLRKRRDNRKLNGNFADDGIETFGDSEDDDEDDSVLASAVDQLMDESTEETYSSVVNIYDQGMPDYTKTSRSGGNLRTKADKTEKEKMIASEREHKKELTDDLYAQMAMRKGNLEERLRQKKAKQSSTPVSIEADSKHTTDVVSSGEDAKDEDEDKLKKLELAFGLVTEMVQGSNGEELKKMDLDSLLALIEHATKVKQGDATAGVKYPVPAQPNGPNNYREGYEDILKDINALLGSRGSGGYPVLGVHEEREQKRRYKEHMDGIMQNKAKNLSSQYNVEKEKYDLRMKIEQARQQQTLQRKLLERRQSNANRPVPSGGAGYSSVAAGNLLAGMMSHANNKSGNSPAKKSNPDSATALKSRGLSTSNLFRK